MPAKRDLTGQTYGLLTVVSESPIRTDEGSVQWNCKCACGGERVVSAYNLRSGYRKSCGCLQTHHQKYGSIKHGHTAQRFSATYAAWNNMLQRCLNPNVKNYDDYGGRGITVCERWLNFSNFLDDMGDRPEGLLLDRENNEEGYYPGNCRWVTRSVSNLNRRPFKRKKAI